MYDLTVANTFINRTYQNNRVVDDNPRQTDQCHKAEDTDIISQYDMPQDRANEPKRDDRHHNDRTGIAGEHPGKNDVNARKPQKRPGPHIT